MTTFSRSPQLASSGLAGLPNPLLVGRIMSVPDRVASRERYVGRIREQRVAIAGPAAEMKSLRRDVFAAIVDELAFLIAHDQIGSAALAMVGAKGWEKMPSRRTHQTEPTIGRPEQDLPRAIHQIVAPPPTLTMRLTCLARHGRSGTPPQSAAQVFSRSNSSRAFSMSSSLCLRSSSVRNGL